MKVSINANYVQTVNIEIDLPNGKTWDDVDNFFVKWGTLNIQFKGEKEYHEFEMDNEPSECNWKNPDSVTVYNPETYEKIGEA